MPAEEISLINFRNYRELKLNFNDAINIFYGENAQGKTNIIEAVFINAVGKSHRTANDGDLIHINEENAKVSLVYKKNDVPNENTFLYLREGRKKIIRNKKNTTVGNIIGAFTAVLFSPEDLMLIKGSPNLRRKFLDREISQADPTYYHELCKFNKITTQRNVLLKNIREGKCAENNLEPWDAQFAESATKITRKRIEAVAKLAEIAEETHRQISANLENLQIRYEIKDFNEGEITSEYFLQELMKKRRQDILRGSTGTGPQHDDLCSFVNGINLKSYGSQGQQRTAVLALKLAEMKFLREETGQYPTLLLDDVMSELDGNRRFNLAEFLRHNKIQTIITATDKNYFSEWKDISLNFVSNGTVKMMT